jgi:fructose-specific component phosphotransferase system IIB-like protein
LPADGAWVAPCREAWTGPVVITGLVAVVGDALVCDEVELVCTEVAVWDAEVGVWEPDVLLAVAEFEFELPHAVHIDTATTATAVATGFIPARRILPLDSFTEFETTS